MKIPKLFLHSKW